MDKLETKNIFIDTSVYFSNNFAFRGELFQRLMTLAADGVINLYITDITKKEIESNIKNLFIEAYTTLIKCRNKARILRNIEDSTFYKLFDSFSLKNEQSFLLEQFNKFLVTAKTNVIPTSEVSIIEVFNKYFLEEPPFNDKKKKNEFPDAFILLALEKWAFENNENMYVISKDNDMFEFCKNIDKLIYIAKIEELFDKLVSEDGYLHSVVTHIINYYIEQINRAISENFAKLEFWVQDEEAEVKSIRTGNIDLNEIFIISADQDSAQISIEAKIVFYPELIYNDDTNLISKEIKQNIYVPIKLEIEYNLENKNHFEIRSIVINENEGIVFKDRSVDEEGYFYVFERRSDLPPFAGH